MFSHTHASFLCHFQTLCSKENNTYLLTFMGERWFVSCFCSCYLIATKRTETGGTLLLQSMLNCNLAVTQGSEGAPEDQEYMTDHHYLPKSLWK